MPPRWAPWEHLANIDDYLSLLLLDCCIFGESQVGGRRTSKMTAGARETRLPVKDLEAVQLLVTELRKGRYTTMDAANAFFKIPHVARFQKSVDRESNTFEVHAKRYLSSLRPDAGIAFHATDRYSHPRFASKLQTTPTTGAGVSKTAGAHIEVAVFATRKFKKGDVIPLRGAVADLTEEEDDALRCGLQRRDFSVLYSARRESFGLLLGPARFVNHDCRNNVEFDLHGSHMSFKVVEDIEPDEQLFTHYGLHYFEENNAACLCSTCEQYKRGLFASTKKARLSTPLVRPPVVPLEPTRRSARQSLGSGHEVTAQRSIARPSIGRSRSLSSSTLSSLASTSSSSSSRSCSPASAIARRSERQTIPLVDALRSQPRVVHPRLSPPPGYKDDYKWESRKKVAVYIGPTTSESELKKRRKSAPPVMEPRKRGRPRKRRPEDESSEEESETESDDSDEDQHKRKRKQLARPQKLVQLGERTSARSVAAREARLKNLVIGIGGDDGDESDLSDLSDSDEEESKQVVAMLSLPRLEEAVQEKVSMTEEESVLSSLEDETSQDEVVLVALPRLRRTGRTAQV